LEVFEFHRSNRQNCFLVERNPSELNHGFVFPRDASETTGAVVRRTLGREL
jgi:hypothetical protein